jgi:hypothetical protein
MQGSAFPRLVYQYAQHKQSHRVIALLQGKEALLLLALSFVITVLSAEEKVYSDDLKLRCESLSVLFGLSILRNETRILYTE